MNLLFLGIGGALLVVGRKLFWLLVAVLGFLFGFYFATQQFGSDPAYLAFAIGLVAGVIGAVLAMFFQGIAIGLAGFLGGGLIAVNLLEFLGLGEASFSWLAFIAGGVLGVILIGLVFEWALILISSLVGAFLIVNAVETSSVVAYLLFFILLVAGIVIQTRIKRRGK